MSWELVSLLITLVLCGTYLANAKITSEALIDRMVSSKVGALMSDSLRVWDRIMALEKDVAAQGKTLEQAKAMMSQQNLAQGIARRP